MDEQDPLTERNKNQKHSHTGAANRGERRPRGEATEDFVKKQTRTWGEKQTRNLRRHCTVGKKGILQTKPIKGTNKSLGIKQRDLEMGQTRP